MKKIDKKAPFKGLTVKQYMKKAHPDITLVKHEDMTVLVGYFCDFADGPVTDTSCSRLCANYSSCDEAMHIGDLAKLVEGGLGVTWCDVCGDVIPNSSVGDIIRVNARGKRYKCCSGTCAGKVMAKK